MAKINHSSNKREPGGFAPLPYIVIRSNAFAQLSAYAVKLLNDLLAQYNGNNNGDLAVAFTLMKKRGWRSKSTLWRAIKELEEGRWIEKTRQGGRNMPNLYAVTFYAVDECNGKMDSHIRPTTRPRGYWKSGGEN